ncbi:aquaporin-5 isoform X2, partial [Biomphalaria glabrata]
EATAKTFVGKQFNPAPYIFTMEALYVHIANKLEGIRFGRPKPSGKLIDLSELRSLDLWRAVFAEFLAQLLFVFLGCAATNQSSHAEIALAFGLAIMALVQMVGHVSGGHINAAVTIAMAVAMNITLLRAVLYIVAQVGGAIVGGFILKGVTPELLNKNLGATTLSNGVTPAQGFGVELILTFCLVTVIFGTTDPNRASFGSPSLLIGLTVTVGHLAGLSYTGSSMNPTRTLGSAVAADIWADHWVYWVGPIAGGVIAAILYKFVLNPYRGVTNLDEAINKL